MSGRFIGIKNIKGRQEFMRMLNDMEDGKDEVDLLYLNYSDLAEMRRMYSVLYRLCRLWCGKLSEQSWIIMQKN